jgi:hypothetical protein
MGVANIQIKNNPRKSFEKSLDSCRCVPRRMRRRTAATTGASLRPAARASSVRSARAATRGECLCRPAAISTSADQSPLGSAADAGRIRAAATLSWRDLDWWLLGMGR